MTTETPVVIPAPTLRTMLKTEVADGVTGQWVGAQIVLTDGRIFYRANMYVGPPVFAERTCKQAHGHTSFCH